MHEQQTAFKNIVKKEEIACNEQFFLSPQCFLLRKIYLHLSIFFTSNLYLVLNQKSPKLANEAQGIVKIWKIFSSTRCLTSQSQALATLRKIVLENIVKKKKMLVTIGWYGSKIRLHIP